MRKTMKHKIWTPGLNLTLADGGAQDGCGAWNLRIQSGTYASNAAFKKSVKAVSYEDLLETRSRFISSCADGEMRMLYAVTSSFRDLNFTAEDKDECSICLEEFDKSGANPCVILPCGHKFHRTCLDEHFNHS